MKYLKDLTAFEEMALQKGEYSTIGTQVEIREDRNEAYQVEIAALKARGKCKAPFADEMAKLLEDARVTNWRCKKYLEAYLYAANAKEYPRNRYEADLVLAKALEEVNFFKPNL